MLTEQDIRSYAVKLLCIKDFSRHKLITKLINKFGPEFTSSIEKLLNDLTTEKLFIEDNYIEARVKGLARKGQSSKMIQYKLSAEGIQLSDQQIKKIYSEAGILENGPILKLLERRKSDLMSEDPKLKAKTVRYLVSKGYDQQKIYSAIESFLGEQGNY